MGVASPYHGVRLQFIRRLIIHCQSTFLKRLWHCERLLGLTALGDFVPSFFYSEAFSSYQYSAESTALQIVHSAESLEARSMVEQDHSRTAALHSTKVTGVCLRSAVKGADLRYVSSSTSILSLLELVARVVAYDIV